jgi:hypothetical protein
MGTICGMVASGELAVGSALAFLATPLGGTLVAVAAISAGLVYGVIQWAKYTESGRQAVAIVSTEFGKLLETAKTTMGGIWDAITGGDLALAGQIAMAGLRVAWQAGLNNLMAGFVAFTNSIIDNFAEAMIGIASRFDDMVLAIAAGINSISERTGAGTLFTTPTKVADVIRGGAMALKVGGGAALSGGESELARLQAELAALRGKASGIAGTGGGYAPGGAGIIEMGKIKASTFGSFSGAALAASAQGGPIEKLVKIAEKALAIDLKTLEADGKLIGRLDRLLTVGG